MILIVLLLYFSPEGEGVHFISSFNIKLHLKNNLIKLNKEEESPQVMLLESQCSGLRVLVQGTPLPSGIYWL